MKTVGRLSESRGDCAQSIRKGFWLARQGQALSAASASRPMVFQNGHELQVAFVESVVLVIVKPALPQRGSGNS